MEVYVVSEYGCNSGAHDVWPPKTKVFTNYDTAYAYFLQIAPRLDDPDNKAEQKVNKFSREEHKDYVRIEHRVQLQGYLDGDGTCAKRPYGAVIGVALVNNLAISNVGSG